MNNVKAEEITTLGRKLDNGVTTVEFNLAPMIDTYGLPDTFMLLLRRNGDEESYAAENFTVSEDKGYWVVTSTDLARTFIYAEIAWIKDDQVYHGEVFKFDVDKSLGTPSDGVNAVMDASTAIPQVLTRLSTAETNISNVNSRIDTEVLPYFARFTVGLNGVASGISSLNTNLRNLRREIINPNLSETSQLHVTTINGAINQNGEHFARVEDGKTYTFSADIAIEELPSALEGRILRNDNTSATQVFSIAEGSTGRVSATFTAVTDGVIYLQGELGSGYDIGDLILDEVQVEEGDYATPYCEYGVVLLPDTEARGEISRINEEISNLRSKRIAGSIVSVADSGLIDDAGLIFPDTEEAFINAKENGFDWVKVYIRKTKDNVVCLSYNGIVSTQSNALVNIDTVDYDAIVNPPMLFCDAVNICNLYGIGMVVKTEIATSALKYIVNQFFTKNISHAFESSTLATLTLIRQLDAAANIIYDFETKPQISDLKNSDDYSSLRQAAASGGVHITFPLAGSDLNQDYIDALNVLGFSLVCGSGESFNTYRLYAKYCSMMISDRYKVSDLLN
jgi:hypothetical protein